ncbi:MAG: PVC-type heme-binding CxxCH protein [Mariniblastus sp.]
MKNTSRTVVSFLACLFALATLVATPAIAQETDKKLNLLFMGDNGHHLPSRRFQELAPALAKRGIILRYTDKMESLNAETLSKFDGLVLYANIDRIEDEQAKAVLEFVANGKGFVPLHCATYCWRNNAEIVALMGGQFQRHGGQVFSTEIQQTDHPIMKGFEGFTSWDETYIHHKHNEKDRVVLEYRGEGEQAKGNTREPWTWVRTHGKGRVFYTAWGHDQRTFDQPGFHNLVERGIRWACGDDPGKAPAFRNTERFDIPKIKTARKDVAKFDYVDVGPKIPNYTAGRNWGTQGDLKTLMQKPLPADESMKHFVTPEGFTIKRYADESDFIAKPIAMTWDERGRLWICETLDYPNELGKNRDRIRICEDTDGDHVADKFTIFAEGLSIPTSIAIIRGGAVIQNATETIYLKDTDGDDVADQSTVLMTGFNAGDTHGGISNFRYGLDNWIWAMQGYNNSKPKYGDKESQSFRQGFWRFKLSQTDPPQVTDVEFLRSSNNNTWGLGFSEEGLIFGSTANGNPSMFLNIPNRYYERVRGWAPETLMPIADTADFDPITDNVRQVDWHGGYTAGAGHALYTARAFPRQWWNKTAFVCGPTGHLVGTFVLRRDGANYTSTSPINLLASDDEWSAPIMAEVGPDGAVWVLDWYNYIVQHNPTPNGFKTGKGAAYESDLRDKRYGRIYRVLPEDETKTHAFSSLTTANNSKLVEALKHPSMPWRLHAQRLLIERDAGKDATVVQSLMAMLGDTSVDEIGLNVSAIHALHTLNGMGQISLTTDNQVSSLSKALTHPSAGVRRNAVAVLPNSQQGLDLLLQHRQVFADSDAQVRLQAVLTLSDMPTSTAAGSLIADLAKQETDKVMIDAITSAASTHAVAFLESVAKNESSTSNELIGVARRISEHVGRGKPDSKSLQRVITGLQQTDSTLAASILDGLSAGLPKGFSLKASESLDTAFLNTFKNGEPKLKVKLVRLAARCGSESLESEVASIIKSTTKTLGDEDTAPAQRLSAAKDLIGFKSRDAGAVISILESITPQTTPDFAAQLLEAIKSSESEQAGQAILESAKDFSPTIKTSAINVLLSKAAWSKSLLDAAESKTFDLDELSLEQKQALRSIPNEDLRKQAEKLLAMGGGLPDADREKVLQSLMDVTHVTGDVDSGREVYKKVCANCHQHGDLGAKIGPNLTGMAVHPKEELLTHIIDPSRNVEGNYRLYKVITFDGQFISGMLAGESKTSITIIDSEAKKIDVQRDDIDELSPSRKSVMPEGFEKQITKKELTDLLEFLTDTGPYVSVPLDDFATAISTKALFHGGNDNGLDRMVFPDWDPKVFNGVPFMLTNPQGKSVKNIILLNGPNGSLPPKMPKSVVIPCNTSVKSIHMLSGVGGWSHPFDSTKTVSMIVRLTYEDGTSEDHDLINAVHFADYIRRVDVPKSEFAYDLNGRQIRYLTVNPKRTDAIKTIELVKGPDNSAPIVMAITIEKAKTDDSAKKELGLRSLKDVTGNRFQIGAGVGVNVLENTEDVELIKKHFQILTPENCMKPQGIRPAEDRWNFKRTDAYAEFARKNGLSIVGHCLVWAKDDRTDEWMMKDGENEVGREKMLERIENHVKTVASRYADVASMWDVVNEAIGDHEDGLLRDSIYSRTTGMDFIVTAFKAARLADPDALLIYNDYNGHKPGKREKLIELLRKLKAAGAPVDAYGMQGHFELGDDSLGQLRETFEELRKMGIKVVVSELDIDVVTRGKWWSEGGKFREELKSFDPYKDGLPSEIEQQQVQQYVELFKLFNEYSDIIERVSFWNLHDGQSWLNYFPWERVNHPLLFDRDRKTKPVFDAVYETMKN